jgi:hypothetical protein
MVVDQIRYFPIICYRGFTGVHTNCFLIKKQFRKVFIQEKIRQWEIKTKKDKIENSYKVLSSDNRAAVGNRLDPSYIPKTNVYIVLINVGERLATLTDDAHSLKKEIKKDDKSLFDDQGIHFKFPCDNFSHSNNLVLCEEMTMLCSNIHVTKLKDKCETTASRFRHVTGGKKRGSSRSTIKNKKWKN